ncbi:MAG: hypothetical protein OXH07_04890 [Chloroflexi bacterium]|nr:hypothetical protein [Chloroflexota bacterium]
MRLRSARALVATILVALALWAASTPGVTVAQDEAPTVTTRLYPGWNMVGWVGKTAPVTELFEAIPELQEVRGWDTEAQRFRRSTPTSRGYRMGRVTPGQGLWLEIGGETAVDWERPVSDRYVLLSLEAGLNLVGWTGSDGTPIEEAFRRWGDAVHYAFRWDAEAQRFDTYVPGGGPLNTLAVLDRGDAFWVEMGRETRWWQSETGRTPFEFGEGVSAERQVEVRRALTNVIGFFAERYGIEPPEFTLSSSEDSSSQVTTHFRGIPPASRVVRSVLQIENDIVEDELESVLAHEYYHVLQHSFARYPYPPSWMTEGAATYASGIYEVSLLDWDGSTIRLSWEHRAEHFGRALKPLEDNTTPGYEVQATYAVGALAVDWLVSHSAMGQGATEDASQLLPLAEQAEHDSYLEYYRLLVSSGSWQEAFETAFGIDPEAFYESFERDREARTGPVVVFFGEVPETAQEDFEALATGTYTFFIESLGVRPFTIASYIAADEEAGRLAQELLIRQGVQGSALSACSYGLKRRAVIHEASCEQSLTHEDYFRRYLEVLSARVAIGPQWLLSGIHAYLETAYAVGAGLAEYDSELRSRTDLARNNPTPLSQLTDADSWRAAGADESRALAFVAIDRLLDPAGTGALKEYVELLPRGEPDWPEYEAGAGSWQAAFEEAFGLTIDDFYQQFSEYRAGLTQP